MSVRDGDCNCSFQPISILHAKNISRNGEAHSGNIRLQPDVSLLFPQSSRGGEKPPFGLTISEILVDTRAYI